MLPTRGAMPTAIEPSTVTDLSLRGVANFVLHITLCFLSLTRIHIRD